MFAFNFALNLQWADIGSSAWPIWRTRPDSLFVANGHYWTNYDIDPSTGAEIPISLQEMAQREGKDPDFYIRQFGAQANAAIRSAQAQLTNTPARQNFKWLPEHSHFAADGVDPFPGQSSYTDRDKQFWEEANRNPNYPGTGEGTLLVGATQQGFDRRPTGGVDRRSFGSLTLLFATPPTFGPLGGKALGNLRTNLVYRIFTGTSFGYTPTVPDPTSPGGIRPLEFTYRYGPLHTRTDLSIVKHLENSSGTGITLSAEIYNLFNQKDVRSSKPDNFREIDFNSELWQRYGIQGQDPSSATSTATEIFDINNYWDSPREVRLSLRLKW